MNTTAGAVRRLLCATAAWGLSFPLAKAVMLLQANLLPGRTDWFHAAFVLMNRMVFATCVMAVLCRKSMSKLTRSEVLQGVELGLFGGLGMLLQTDAQHFMQASTSAFFTQFTCIFVPVVVALRERVLPPKLVVLACLLVLTGCAVLSGVSAEGVHFGRGEWETIGAALLFTGQILALEKERFRRNDMSAAATVMFSVKSLVLFPIVCWGGGPAEGVPFQHWGAEMSALYTSGPLWILLALLTLFSTVYGYATMTRWQPLVSSTQAGLIYATEPVFATLWALFLPGWASSFAGVSYSNETLTHGFFWGAGLILTANLVLLLRRPGTGSVQKDVC